MRIRGNFWISMFVFKYSLGEALGGAAATRIVESTVTVSYPKITEPPLYRRKIGSNKWDSIHEEIQGRKRDVQICPENYQLCPRSVDGGCCPNGRSCGISSCYASTASKASTVSTASSAPAFACNILGYIACPVDEGGTWRKEESNKWCTNNR